MSQGICCTPRFCCFHFTIENFTFPIYPSNKQFCYPNETRTKRKKMKNKISIFFIKYPNCNLIKLLWDAANRLQVSWNQRNARRLKKCGYLHNHFHQQLRLLLRNKRKPSFSILIPKSLFLIPFNFLNSAICPTVRNHIVVIAIPIEHESLILQDR